VCCVTLQAKYLPAQLDAMQEEARKQAEQELAALKVEAQLQAQLLQQEKVGMWPPADSK
jgi:hypothetical protein